MFVDIHTHVDNQSVIKIVDDFSEKILMTWGIHPWDLRHFERNGTKCGAVEKFSITESLCEKRISPFRFAPVEMTGVFAVGEVGLDKVHNDTFEKQVEVFEEMIRLSESYHKPMIIHCVRAYSEIIEMRKKTKATMPWVIHGFNSSVETMRQLLRYDMYISLGEILYRNENQAIKILNDIPVERLFLETDVSGRDIKDVYYKAAALMGCEVEFLCNKIFENYGRLEAAH
ncbi:MAG: TatD family hydrolase [Bacteroidales bacterium]|nr:TatD family hydrolase [Bacteroidales bacterium]